MVSKSGCNCFCFSAFAVYGFYMKRHVDGFGVFGFWCFCPCFAISNSGGGGDGWCLGKGELKEGLCLFVCFEKLGVGGGFG